MPGRRYELREAGTGRLLGEVETVDDLPAGAVSLLLASGTVQVEDPAPPAAAGDDTPPPARSTRRSRTTK